MKTMKPKLYVIDISNYIHRAFHGIKDLKTSSGMPTNAIYGTINMLSRFIFSDKPEYICVCYDSPTDTNIRKTIYPEYKSNRGPAVNALSAQEMIIRVLIDSLGMYGVAREGYEADDLIATIVKRFCANFDITILTGDKDMGVLLKDGVRIYDSMKGKYITADSIVDKFGVQPDQISEYLAIVGDKVDNIPGIPNIGSKGAQEILSKYQTLTEFNESSSLVGPKLTKKIIDGYDLFQLSLKLSTMFSDIDIPTFAQDLTFAPKQNDKILKLFDKLEFQSLRDKLFRIWRLYS